MNDVPMDEQEYATWRRADPDIEIVVVVQCEGFRCLAYRDAEVWREFESGEELPEVKHIVSTFSM